MERDTCGVVIGMFSICASVSVCFAMYCYSIKLEPSNCQNATILDNELNTIAYTIATTYEVLSTIILMVCAPLVAVVSLTILRKYKPSKWLITSPLILHVITGIIMTIVISMQYGPFYINAPVMTCSASARLYKIIFDSLYIVNLCIIYLVCAIFVIAFLATVISKFIDYITANPTHANEKTRLISTV